MKPCNVVNCILKIKCSLNLLVSYVCFDICGGIERASSRGHRAKMQFPKNFCPLCDKQVIASALGQLRINFTCIFKFFPKLPSSLRDSGTFRKTLKIRVKLILNCPRAHAITHTKIIYESWHCILMESIALMEKQQQQKTETLSSAIVWYPHVSDKQLMSMGQ